MCVGGWLAPGSGARLLIGLILIFSSATWLLLLIKGRLSKPMAKSEAKVWGKVSEGGKGKYIRKAIVMGLPLGIASNSILMFDSFKVRGISAEDLEIFVSTTLIATFTFGYGAARIRDLNVKRNKKL
jgi:hypothetical protein